MIKPRTKREEMIGRRAFVIGYVWATFVYVLIAMVLL